MSCSRCGGRSAIMRSSVDTTPSVIRPGASGPYGGWASNPPMGGSMGHQSPYNSAASDAIMGMRYVPNKNR